MSHARARLRLWRWPVAVAVLTLAGLPAALMAGNGPARWLCWIALIVPLAISGYAVKGAFARRDGQ